MAVINLPIEEMPRKWFNILPDLGGVPPPKGEEAIGKLQQYGIKECLKQEFSDQKYIPIPPELLKKYEQIGRPRPLVRAERLEKALKLPEDKIRLYFKREDLSPTGSHKVNTAVAQAYFAAQEEKEILVTETGAGQWGSALAYGSMLNNLDSRLFWVRSVYNWKPDRRAFMKSMGAEVWASPSKITKVGRELLKQDPEHPGSLSIAIAEGIENTLDNLPEAGYSLGSVLNHVLMHQTVIGQEAIKQFEKVDDYPDVILSCLGGGSNYGGLMIPFAGQVLRGENEKEIEFIAAQSEVAPNLSKGEYRYDYADHGEQTPQLKMLTLGHQTEMEPIRGDGLRYHGAAPIISKLRADKKMVKTVVYPKDEKLVFEGATLLWQEEGVLAASESAYSVRCAIDEALQAKRDLKKGKIDEKVILFNLSGHGLYDLTGYSNVLGDRMGEKISLEDLSKDFTPRAF